MLNKPLQRLTSGEPGISGAVTLAAIGTGIYSNFEEASTALSQYRAPNIPDPEQVKIYASIFEIYKDAIKANANIGKRLTHLGEG